MSRLRRRIVLGLSAVTTLALVTATPAVADKGWHGKPPTDLPKVPLMVGSGGAVSSVDREASQVGIDVLARGGNAADAAVATAAALGVTEPYSAGIGGGGFLVYYDAKTKKVSTIDGRETAPKSFTPTVFQNPRRHGAATSTPWSTPASRSAPRARPALWDQAASHVRDVAARAAAQAGREAGREAASSSTRPSATRPPSNAARFRKFPATAAVFLPGNAPPVVGSTFRNPDMAKAYSELRTHGVASLYGGRLGQAVVDEAQNPTTAPGVSVYKGQLTLGDLTAYRALDKDADHLAVQGVRRLRHAGAELGRHRRRARPSTSSRHTRRRPGASSGSLDTRQLPALVLRGHRHGLRRPEPLRRRRSPTCRSAS